MASQITQAPSPGLRWRRVFPGEESQLAILRRWLAGLLPPCPARDDVTAVATELGSNAVKHTRSGQGACFAVEVTWHGATVRVTVADRGGASEPQVLDDPAAEHGRGLLLVRGLSRATGVTGDHRGRLVWADVSWSQATGQPLPQDPYEDVVRDGEAALALRFSHVPAWYGRATMQWWALADQARLVAAPSAPELASLLYRLLDTQQPPHVAEGADEVEVAECHALPKGRVTGTGPWCPSRDTAPRTQSSQSAFLRTLQGELQGCHRHARRQLTSLIVSDLLVLTGRARTVPCRPLHLTTGVEGGLAGPDAAFRAQRTVVSCA
ncbi:MAG TPA: ATP-binding protein [Streptosporangiaceae bacterium]|nr:ATP-binding protein [Streptosporangiaceae bacterium]